MDLGFIESKFGIMNAHLPQMFPNIRLTSIKLHTLFHKELIMVVMTDWKELKETAHEKAGAAPVRVPRMPGHPLIFSNGCLAPVLKCPWVSKSPFVTKNTKILSSNFTFY